jgi:hypothetical protein
MHAHRRRTLLATATHYRPAAADVGPPSAKFPVTCSRNEPAKLATQMLVGMQHLSEVMTAPAHFVNHLCTPFCVISATLGNSFETATVQGGFSAPLSLIYYNARGVLHEDGYADHGLPVE